MTAQADDVETYSQFTTNGSAFTKYPTICTRERTFTVSGIDFEKGAVVRRAVLTANISNSLYGINTATIGSYDVRNNSSVSLRFDVKSNRDVYISFTFRSYGRNGVMAAGSYTDWLYFRDLKLTVTFDEGEDLEPDPEPQMTLEPELKVVLYKQDETDFTHNGVCVLSPTVCKVSEEAGGAYELSMEHPLDPYGKWRMITQGSIIKAPIPPIYIPPVTMPPWSVLVTTAETKLYSILPSYVPARGETAVENVRNNPSQYEWISGTYYISGTYVVRNSAIYRARRGTVGQHPPDWPDAWSFVANLNRRDSGGSGSGQYKPGTVIETLASGVQIYKIADYNSLWVKIRALSGRTGYIRKDDCTTTGQSETVTYPARTLYTQLFRVYEVGGDETGTIQVSARHISYDLQKNCLFDCQLEDCEPPSAMANIQGSMINADDTIMVTDTVPDGSLRILACNMTEPTIRANWSFQNPMQALLDPEEGLAGQVKGKVIRDNQDIFILDNTRPRRGPAIRFGVNLRGVTWSRSTDELVTRIIPRAKDGDSYLYLDELYIDSPYIDRYPVICTEVLDSQYSVDQTITRVDGTSYTLSRSDVIEKMREEVENRYYVDHCDAVRVSLDVDFVLLGDTEEYRQYRHLQRLNIYDRIMIDAGNGLQTQAQVSGYEWDCLLGRYDSISIGKVYAQVRAGLPGYRMASGSVTYSKLAPDLITYIKGSD